MDNDNNSSPFHGSITSKVSNTAEEDSPNPKRQRMTRGDRLARKSVDYDMKYHPMDDVVRPKAAAAAKRRAFDRPNQKLLDDEDEGSLDEGASDVPTSTRKPAEPHTPERIRITRAGTLGEKVVDYDMKHHPMDDVLRPKATAKRSVWFKSVSPPILSQKLANSTKTSSTVKDGPKNPFTKPSHEDWKDLHAFDRRVYLLQKGSLGNTLPLAWSKVVKVLIEDGFFTREQFDAWGGIEALKSRYESTRLAVEGFFGAKPEPITKMAWQVFHAEGFEVYKMGVGEKYWPHYGDSIVRPFSVKKGGDLEPAVDVKDVEDPPEVSNSSKIQTTTRMDSNGLETRGSETTVANLDYGRAALAASPNLSHDTEYALQAEDQLMESLRSAPSSEVGTGTTLMNDDELEAILGDMGADNSSVMHVAVEEPSVLSRNLNHSMLLLESCDDRLQKSTTVNEASSSKSLYNSRKPAPSAPQAGTAAIIFGDVPLNVLKAVQRMEPQIHNPSKRPSGEISGIVGQGTLGTEELLSRSKTPKKVYKRSSKTKSSNVDFEVHEDQPGNTPLIKKQIALHPKSPGTDVKKENFDHRNQADSNTAHDRLQDALVNSPSTVRHSEGRLARPNSSRFRSATSATLQPSPEYVVADGRVAGNMRMGPNAFVAPLTPRSTRIRRI